MISDTQKPRPVPPPAPALLPRPVPRPLSAPKNKVQQVLTNEETEELKYKSHKALFQVQSSIRYHSRLCHFYKTLNACTIIAMVINTLVATSYLAIYTLSTSTWVLAIIALAAGTMGILNLALGWQHKIKEHDELKRRFIQTENLFNKGTLDQKELEKAKKAILRIEKDEPPILHLLNTVCHCETQQSYDSKKTLPRVSWRRFSMHFLSHAEYASRIDVDQDK